MSGQFLTCRNKNCPRTYIGTFIALRNPSADCADSIKGPDACNLSMLTGRGVLPRRCDASKNVWPAINFVTNQSAGLSLVFSAWSYSPTAALERVAKGLDWPVLADQRQFPLVDFSTVSVAPLADCCDRYSAVDSVLI